MRVFAGNKRNLKEELTNGTTTNLAWGHLKNWFSANKKQLYKKNYINKALTIFIADKWR